MDPSRTLSMGCFSKRGKFYYCGFLESWYDHQMKKSTPDFEIFFALGEEQMYLGMEPTKKTAKEDWVKHINHDAIKLLLRDGPKD